jgi:hypothetical protein
MTFETRTGMSITEAFLMTPAESHSERELETASPTDRAGSCETTEDTGSQVGGEVFKTEAELWQELLKAEERLRATPESKAYHQSDEAMMATPEWKRRSEIRDQWAIPYRARMATGCSRSTVPCGQADHLRQVVAAGEKPTVNEAY